MFPNPYVLIGAAVLWIGSIIGAGVFWGHHVALGYEVKISKQNADAEQLLAQLTATAAAKDAAESDFARNLEQEHADAARAITDAATTAERSYTDKLRHIAASRASCPSAGTAKTGAASGADQTAARSRDQLLATVGHDLRELGEGAQRLADYAKECVAWAAQVGR